MNRGWNGCGFSNVNERLVHLCTGKPCQAGRTSLMFGVTLSIAGVALDVYFDLF